MQGSSQNQPIAANAQTIRSEDRILAAHEHNECESTHERTTSEQPLSSSWLGQVKGRIAKTVQEKYSEYKHDNELRKQANAAAIIIPNSSTSSKVDNHSYNPEKVEEDADDEGTVDWPKGIAHSMSMDGNFSEPCSLSSPAAEKLMSELYSSDIKSSKSTESLKRIDSDRTSENDLALTTPMLCNKEDMDLDLKNCDIEKIDSTISSEITTPVPLASTENETINLTDTATKTKITEHSQNTNVSPLQTPERLRRRYLAFPSLYSSFRSKTNSPHQSNLTSRNEDESGVEIIGDSSSNQIDPSTGAGTVSTSSLSSTLTTVSHTPKGSLKNRMWNLMGKSPSSGNVPNSSQPVNIPSTSRSYGDSLISVSMSGLQDRSPMEDPFSGFDSSLQLHDKDSPDHEKSPSQDDSDLETGIEIDEDFVIFTDPDMNVLDDDKEGSVEGLNDSVDAEVVVHVPDNNSFWPLENLQFWWMAALPLCILLLLQILPLPSWIIGFVTGILISVPLSAYVTYWMFGDFTEPATPFVENLKKKVAKQPAIIVQHELERKFVWMNLWPTKKGSYDPLTYDVRRTSTVRLMLHGPWIEMRFPKRNLPLRRMHDDVEPTKVDFHDQVEVIDLSTCSIDLLPENLPSKRMWSKKYPIRIRTNMRKQTVTNSETSKKMQAKVDSKDSSPDTVTEQDRTILDETNGATTKENDTEPTYQRSLETEFNQSKSGDLNNVERTRGNDEKQNNTVNMDDEDIFSDAFEDDMTPNVRPTSLPVKLIGKELKDCDIVNLESENIHKKDKDDLASGPVGPEPSVKSSVTETEIDDSSPKEENPNKTFYLFTRTGREKEEWYNRFMVAANFMEDWEHQNPKSGEKIDPNYETQKVREQKFRMFMEDYFQGQDEEAAVKRHKETKETPEMIQCAKEQAAFLNVYMARMWHDLHDSKVFLEFLREKLSRKLLKVKIAHYFNEVHVTELDLGSKLPQILSASLPWQDELGLWANLEIEYNGVCQATVETKGIRLPGKDEPDREAQELLRLFSRQAATMDSDEEDSAEEDDDPITQDENDGGDGDIACDKLQPHAGFKARILDKVLKSDFVAKVSNYQKYIACCIFLNYDIIASYCFYKPLCFVFCRLQNRNGSRKT